MKYLFSQSLAPTTLRLYNSAYRNYILFCSNANLLALPIIERNLLKFYVTSLSYKSIKVYLVRLQFHSISLGDLSNMFQLFYLLCGIRHVQCRTHSRISRMPITVPDLHSLHRFIITTNFSGQHLLWHFSVYYVPLNILLFTHQFLPQHTLISSNIGFAGDYSYMSLHIQSSKTDPFRDGCIIWEVLPIISYVQCQPCIILSTRAPSSVALYSPIQMAHTLPAIEFPLCYVPAFVIAELKHIPFGSVAPLPWHLREYQTLPS